jgi:glucose-6-phosphate 1-epimerase
MTTINIAENAFGRINQTALRKGFSVIEIDHKYGKASISLYGGQVLSWQPVNQKDVFWLSDSCEYQQGKAIRGGIPLCWPWFGPNQGGGNHGFARQRTWQLHKVEIIEDYIKIVLQLHGDNEHSLWPTRFFLEQELTFSKQFQQILKMTNLSEQKVEYSSALHSYFLVSKPLNVAVDSLSGVLFDDKITGKKAQSDKLTHCFGPLDRIYHCADVQQIIDRGWGRTITVSSEHCHQWVLWNPGKAIANNMSDIHAGGENEFVCLEAANTQWQALAPLESISLSQTVSVTSL